MIAALLARFGLNLSLKTLAWFLAILAVIGSIVATYLYFERTQKALLAATRSEAISQVSEQVAATTAASERAQTVMQDQEMNALDKSNADYETQWNKIFGEVVNVPDEVAPNTPAFVAPLTVVPMPVVNAPEKINDQSGQAPRVNPAIDDLNRASNDVDLLLERASNTANRGR